MGYYGIYYRWAIITIDNGKITFVKLVKVPNPSVTTDLTAVNVNCTSSHYPLVKLIFANTAPKSDAVFSSLKKNKIKYL